eukprot:2840251-Prymnesium_polylepis.2
MVLACGERARNASGRQQPYAARGPCAASENQTSASTYMTAGGARAAAMLGAVVATATLPDSSASMPRTRAW